MNGKQTAMTTGAAGSGRVKVKATRTVRPDARQVYLAADFGDWETSPLRTATRKGSSRAAMTIKPAERRNSFLVDGNLFYYSPGSEEWPMDPVATRTQSPRRTIGSVIRV